MKKPAQNWYSNKPNSGQALLIVLLGMAVVLTLVLSIVSRSVTDVSITTKDEESLRAFSAAEAGVEQLLIGGSGSGEFPNSSYTAQVYDIGNSEYYFFPNQLKSGDVVTLWFVEHDDQGNLTCAGGTCVDANGKDINFCWGDKDTPGLTPAIEVAFYYDETLGALNGNYSGVRVVRGAFDPDTSRDNNFNSANDLSCSGWEVAYDYQTGSKSLNSDYGIPATCREGCLLFARIKMIYNISSHGIAARLINSTFPNQGKKIESTGTSGDATRKVEAIQTFSEPLPIFENAVFSNAGDLSK